MIPLFIGRACASIADITTETQANQEVT